VLEAIGNSTDSGQLAAFGAGLTEAVGNPASSLSVRQFRDCLEALRRSRDTERIEVFAAGLTNIAARLEAAQSVEALNLVAQGFAVSGEARQHVALIRIVDLFTARESLSDLQAKALVEMCRSPFVDRAAVAAAIRKSNRQAPPEVQGSGRFSSGH
jgi:hypothetical protein